MRPHDSAVRHHALHVGVVAEVVEQISQDTMVTPAGKAFVDTIPVAILVRQVSPLGAGSQDPQARFQEAAALIFLAHVDSRLVAQKQHYLLPLVIA